MSHVHAMAALNRKILEAYSRRTTDTLRMALPMRMALPSLENFLAMNVAKEVRKDALVIRRVGEHVALGVPPTGDAASQLFAATQQVDREFLARAENFPVGIVIRYDEIAPLRTQRIDKLLTAAYRILDAGRTLRGSRSAIRAAICSTFARDDFERLLQDLLRLYALETRALSRSLSLPRLLVPLRERLVKSLYEIMNDTANRLARELASCVYRPERLARL